MKYALLLFTLFYFSMLFSQEIIYTNGRDNVYTLKEYEQKKDESLKKFQKVSKRMQLYETLDTLKITSDSLILKYSWFFTDNMKKIQKEEEKVKSYIGMEYPINNSTTLDGVSISLSDLKGKPTLINLWFISCPPCIEEMPSLNALHEKYGDRFNFLAITFEKEKNVREFLKKHPYTLPHITDEPLLTRKMFKSYPVNIILDKEGKIYSIEDSVPYQKQEDGTYAIGDGSEFIAILESLL